MSMNLYNIHNARNVQLIYKTAPNALQILFALLVLQVFFLNSCLKFNNAMNLNIIKYCFLISIYIKKLQLFFIILLINILKVILLIL